MNHGFLINLINGVRHIVSRHKTDTHEVWITINRDNPEKISFMGMFQATPDFLNDFVNLCKKHFNKEED